MDRTDAQAWLDRYVAAWLSYDADDIASLFTEDVLYRYHPYDDPIVGREAVVASWLGEANSDGASTRDAPGTYAAQYEPVAVDGEIVVATGTSSYRERLDGPIVRVTTPHIPLAAAANLEDSQLPSVAKIVAAVERLVD